MNWVLVILLWANNGATSEQIGPYASHGDCEKAYTIAESQDEKDKPRIRHHFCIPKPKTGAYVDSPREFPEEFD